MSRPTISALHQVLNNSFLLLNALVRLYSLVSGAWRYLCRFIIGPKAVWRGLSKHPQPALLSHYKWLKLLAVAAEPVKLATLQATSAAMYVGRVTSSALQATVFATAELFQVPVGAACMR